MSSFFCLFEKLDFEMLSSKEGFVFFFDQNFKTIQGSLGGSVS